jgi:hypothetical protein
MWTRERKRDSKYVTSKCDKCELEGDVDGEQAKK